MSPFIQPDWKWGTAEGSRELDRLLDRRLSFREKLEWLEEAESLSLTLRASREARARMVCTPDHPAAKISRPPETL
jgi:hypothetical protein